MSKINQQIQRIAERYKTNENNTELKEDMQSLLSLLNEDDILANEKPKTIGTLVSARLEQLKDTDILEQQIIRTGFEDFDSELGGFLKGELVVIGARPGMGKTQFIVNLCTNIASQGKACGFLSLELSSYLLANRFISNISKVSHQELMKGDFKEQNDFNIKDAVSKLNRMPIYIYDQYVNSIFSIVERCKSLVEENKVEVVFIDYVQLIGNNNGRYNRESELAMITRKLKRLAKELNIVVIVTSQLSRQVENRPGGSKRPQLSDLRESGAIEQDADMVLFLYRPEYYGLEVDENNEPTRYVMEVIVAKNNTGNCETIKLMSEKYLTGFKKYTGPYTELSISQERLNDLN